MRLRASVRALGALAMCGVVAVCTLYVARSTAQGVKEGEPRTESNTSPIYGVTVPTNYRDWRLISVKRVTGAEGKPKQLRAQLGNDVAITAFRERQLPFPDGTIIAALHWNEAAADADNQVLANGFPGAGLESSFCRGRRERSIHGQGLKEVRCVRRLGIRRLQERHTW